jgi:glucose/mannose transport system permease protein
VEIFFRVAIYSILIVTAIYYLIPLIIMVFTSVKTMEDIRTGTLISFPRHISFDARRNAWPSMDKERRFFLTPAKQ